MHKMRDHTSIEDAIRHTAHWEDPDQMLIVGTTENGRITVSYMWQGLGGGAEADSLLDAIHIAFPDCWCDEE